MVIKRRANLRNIFLKMVCCGLMLFSLGCAGTAESPDKPWGPWITFQEADWIRSGEPIEFEGIQWFPSDNLENLLDTEVYPVSEYRGVQIFTEYSDVRPYNRLYTRFNKNRYRLFEQKKR